MAEQNLSVDIKIKADTSGAKEATKAIDGVDKAVADLSKTEKEATNINGMYLDSLGRIHDASGKFVKVAAEERAGLKERIKLQQEETGAVDRSTVTTNGAAQAKEKLAKSSNNGAMGLLALSNAVQDVQYGFGGMVNNIPQIITGLGMGMGVAGAVQIAAVGVQFLTKNFDLFGTELAAASKEATEAANEATALAAATERTAKTAEDAAKKQKELAEALKETQKEYEANVKAADEMAEAARRLQDIETKRADLQSDLALAEVDSQLASGQISGEDANAKRAGIRAQRDARAAELQQKALAQAQKAEEDKAKAAEAAAKEQESLIEGRLNYKNITGLNTPKGRQISQTNLDAAEKEAESAKKAVEEKQAQYESGKRATLMTSVGGYVKPFEDTDTGKRLAAEIEATKERETRERNRAQVWRQDLADDAAAQKRTGFDDRTKFEEAQRAASETADKFRKEAGEARKRSSVIGENLALATETTATRAKIASLTQSSAAAASAQSGYGIGFTGPIPPQGFDVDQKEAAKAAKEAESANRSNTAATIKIIRALAGELKLTKEQLLALNGVVEDIRSTK